MKRSHKTQDSGSSSRSVNPPKRPYIDYNVQDAIARMPMVENGSENLQWLFNSVLNQECNIVAMQIAEINMDRLLRGLLSTSVLRRNFLQNEIRVLDGDSRNSLKRNLKVDHLWKFTDLYANPITQTDMNFLDEIIEEFEDKLYLNVPEIGAHYTDDGNDECFSEEENLIKATSNTEQNKNGISQYVDPLSFTARLILSGALEERPYDYETEPIQVTEHLKEGELMTVPITTKESIRWERKLQKEFIDLTKEYIQDELLDSIKNYQEQIQNLQATHSATLHKLKELATKNQQKQDDVHQEIVDLCGE